MFNWIKDWKQWREQTDEQIRKMFNDEPEYQPRHGWLVINFGEGAKTITVSEAITALADYLDVDINALTKTVVANKKEKKAHKD
jgi:hypothetical protein